MMKNISLRWVLKKPEGKLAPATLAIVIQIAALMTVFLCVLIINLFFAVRFTVFTLVVMQSLSAVALCGWTGMAVWWRWIHGVFPLAIALMSMTGIPNEVYLVGFLVSLSVFWTTYRSQVPFFPSRPIVREKVAQLIPLGQATRMIDIGSGLGDLSMYIANQRSNCQVEGIEIAPLPWLISAFRAWISRSSATFTLGDYHALDFAQYDLVFAYLSPAAMPALWLKARQEMLAGSLLVSYEFEIVGIPPAFIIKNSVNTPSIYVWKM
jgi:hypothetical protein